MHLNMYKILVLIFHLRYKKRSNDPECPFFQLLPKEKNMRYNLRNTSVSVPRIYTDRFKNVFSNRIIFRYDM